MSTVLRNSGSSSGEEGRDRAAPEEVGNRAEEGDDQDDEHPERSRQDTHPVGRERADEREHQKNELHRSQEDEQPDHEAMMTRLAGNGDDQSVTSTVPRIARLTVIAA